jgi:uncharacterized repeat protein (TIGR01451 family)
VTCSHPGSLAADSRSDVGVDVQVAKNASLGIWSGAVATAGDPNPGNDTGSQIMIFTKIDASVTISHSGDFVAGTPGSFTVTVKNGGSAATIGTTTVRDQLPAGLEFASGGGSGWTCGQGGGGAICEHPASLAPGESSSFEIGVTPTAAAVPQAVNTVTVATEDDANAANDSATDTVTVAEQAPKPRLAGGKLSIGSGKAGIEVGCLPSGGPCAGTLALGPKAGSSAYGSGRYSLEPGTSQTVTVKLSKAAKKILAKKGKLKAVASAAGAQAKVKLTGPKKG